MNVPAALPFRREAMRVAGKLIETGETIDVVNPYSGAVVGTVPAARPEHVRDAFAKARAFKPRLTRFERQRILQTTAEMLRDRKETFARLITAESGLCWKDSLYEASRAYDVWSFAAQLVIKDDGEIYSCDISPNGKMRKIYTTRTPLLGVVAAITPFNHPLNMVSHKLAPAIATNNRVVLKPTELTPLTALALVDVLYEAGLPPEMLSVVTGSPATMGDAMIVDPGLRPRHLHRFGQGRQTHRRDRRLSPPGARTRRQRPADRHGGRRSRQGGRPRGHGSDQEFRPALHRGQAHPGGRKRRRSFCREGRCRARRRSNAAIRSDPETDVGTVINERSAKLFEARVADAVSHGAERAYTARERKGALFPPVVVDHVPFDCELVREETFGPVIPIIRCPDDIGEVIRISNSTAFGLSSGVCTNRLDYVGRFVAELEVGTVNVWEVPGYRIEMSPFGGVKDSGLGYKEGVVEAMKSFTNVKTYSLPWSA